MVAVCKMVAIVLASVAVAESVRVPAVVDDWIPRCPWVVLLASKRT
jgi:hypothetical protein